jgi:hypothetical protein
LVARGAFVLAALFTLLVGYYVVERFRGQAAWRAYEAEARLRGVKIAFSDFLPPKIPDAENFASIPIFDAAFRAADRHQEAPNPFKLPRRKGGELPKLSDPTKQTVIDLGEWRKYFTETGLLPVAGNNAAADVLEALNHFGAPLAQLREAGTRPHSCFPVHWEQKWSAVLPHLELLRDATKLDALRLDTHLALGDSRAAYEDFRDGLRLAMALREEPSLICGLVRIANSVLLLNAVWDGLAQHRWAEPELRRIESDLGALDWLRDLQFAMGSERAFSNDLINLVITNPRLAAMIVQSGSPSMNPDAIVSMLRVYPTGWHYRSMLRMNRYFDEMLAQVEPDRRRWFGDRPTPSSPQNLTTLPSKIHYLFFSLATPVFETAESRWIHTATVTDQARLACALERYRLARGNYPGNLAELAPEFIPEVPLEIVNGEPYHYRRTDDGSFILYSVGTDLHDDGGVIDPKLSASKQRDWVWRYPAK